jgi:hypothetical protein
MNTLWIKRLMAGGILAGLVALAGCASTPDVRSDFDRSVDFTQYKTFAFANPLGTDRAGYQTLVSQHLKAAAQRELEARGMRLDENAPQVLVNFNAVLSEKLRVSTMPAPTMGLGMGLGGRGYYGYRMGMYGTFPLYEERVSQYTEGTLNIDIVDARRKQLVWEGVVKGTVTQKTMDNLQPAINAAVTAAFARYPVPGPAAKPASK